MLVAKNKPSLFLLNIVSLIILELSVGDKGIYVPQAVQDWHYLGSLIIRLR